MSLIINALIVFGDIFLTTCGQPKVNTSVCTCIYNDFFHQDHNLPASLNFMPKICTKQVCTRKYFMASYPRLYLIQLSLAVRLKHGTFTFVIILQYEIYTFQVIAVQRKYHESHVAVQSQVSARHPINRVAFIIQSTVRTRIYQNT